MSTKAFKQEKIEYFKSQIEKAKVAVVTNFSGLSVEEITKLRRALQKENADYTVTKNTLVKLAAKGTEFEALEPACKGPVALAFGFGDEVAAAKVCANFIKETKKGEILGAVLNGNLLSAEEAKALATLPSRDELYAKMLGCVNSPVTGIVGSVNAVMSSLVRAIDAVAKQKQA